MSLARVETILRKLNAPRSHEWATKLRENVITACVLFLSTGVVFLLLRLRNLSLVDMVSGDPLGRSEWGALYSLTLIPICKRYR